MFKLVVSICVLGLLSEIGVAQQPDRPEDFEPGVSFDDIPVEAPPAGEAEVEAPQPSAPPPEAARAEPVESSATSYETMDHLNLDVTSVTGNRELPKVLYIVPWKKSDLGDLSGRPVNSLLDEVLSPVDREVFQRHLQYYGDVRTE